MNETWDKPLSSEQLWEARSTEDVMPKRDEIPSDFWNDRNKWHDMMSHLFFSGGKKTSTKHGISKTDAWHHLGHILSSFDTEHNHKIAAAAYLGSLWLDENSIKHT
jgi:hypothetical protein